MRLAVAGRGAILETRPPCAAVCTPQLSDMLVWREIQRQLQAKGTRPFANDQHTLHESHRPHEQTIKNIILLAPSGGHAYVRMCMHFHMKLNSFLLANAELCDFATHQIDHK